MWPHERQRANITSMATWKSNKISHITDKLWTRQFTIYSHKFSSLAGLHHGGTYFAGTSYSLRCCCGSSFTGSDLLMNYPISLSTNCCDLCYDQTMQMLQMILLQHYHISEMFSLSIISMIFEETRIAKDQVLLQVGISQPRIISSLSDRALH